MDDDGTARKRPDRVDRLKTALRENLRRRKAQARGRTQTPDETSERAEKPSLPAGRDEQD